jgi:DMSO reductase anchor subunit
MPNPRALFMILFGVLVFTVLLQPTGLFVATAVLTAIVSFASSETHWREAAVISIALAGAAILIFVYALGLPIQALPKFGFL